MPVNDRPILIVDGLNVFIRHFIANPTISSKGESAGGIVGFMKNLQNVVELTFPGKVIIAWEGGGSSRRRQIFPEYKEKRRPETLNRFYEDDIPNTVENRDWQLINLIALLKNTPVHQVYVENCEADDVIGYICGRMHQGSKKIILTSDRDLYQLISPDVRVFSTNRKCFVTESDVMEQFGMKTNNFCLAKAISGDPSDNIPGIDGVSFKSLAKKFPEFSSVDDLTVDWIVSEAANRAANSAAKIFSKIVEGEGTIRRNWRLMHLDTSNLSASQIKKIEYVIDSIEVKRDKMGFLRGIVKNGLGSFDADRFLFTLGCIPTK